MDIPGTTKTTATSITVGTYWRRVGSPAVFLLSRIEGSSGNAVMRDVSSGREMKFPRFRLLNKIRWEMLPNVPPLLG